MKKNLKLIVVLNVVFFVIFGMVSIAAEYNLKLGHDQPIAQPYHEGANFFAERVNELTNGRVKIAVYPNAQLGDELSMLDSLGLGDIDFSIAAAPNAATHVKELGFFSVSYLFNNQEHFIKTMKDPEFLDLVQEKEAKYNIGFKTIGFLTCGLRNVYNIKCSIKTPDDLKDLKMRVMAAPIEATVWKLLGTKPISIPFGDIYTALQTGLIEAAEGSISSYFTAKHNEIAKYYSLTNHQWLVTTLNVSSKTWSKLPDDVKNAMIQAAKEMTKYEINYNVNEDKKMLKEMQDNYGVVVNEVDITPFQNILKPLQDKTAEELGMDKVLGRIRELQD